MVNRIAKVANGTPHSLSICFCYQGTSSGKIYSKSVDDTELSMDFLLFSKLSGDYDCVMTLVDSKAFSYEKYATKLMILENFQGRHVGLCFVG